MLLTAHSRVYSLPIDHWHILGSRRLDNTKRHYCGSRMSFLFRAMRQMTLTLLQNRQGVSEWARGLLFIWLVLSVPNFGGVDNDKQ